MNQSYNKVIASPRMHLPRPTYTFIHPLPSQLVTHRNQLKVQAPRRDTARSGEPPPSTHAGAATGCVVVGLVGMCGCIHGGDIGGGKISLTPTYIYFLCERVCYPGQVRVRITTSV